MNVLGLIPARCGSKGIPSKNIVSCAGLPLLEWTARAVHGSSCISRCILSSDCEEIQSVAKDCGIEVPFVRPSEISQDMTPALPVIKHAITWMEQYASYTPDVIVLLQPTSPLRLSRHIDEAVELLLSSPDADSVVSVVEVPHQYAPASVMVLEGGVLRSWMEQKEDKNLRQLKPKFWARNGAAIYAFRRSCLFNKGSIYGDVCLPYFMSPEESVDVDTYFDLKVCEMLLAERLEGTSA